MNKRYLIMGECHRCGQCCENENCEYFELGDPSTCRIYNKERPPKCGNYPAAPPIMFKKCSYYFLDTWEDNRIVEVGKI